MPDDYLNLEINQTEHPQPPTRLSWPEEYEAVLRTARDCMTDDVQQRNDWDDVEVAQILVGLTRYASEIREGLAAGLLPRRTVDVPLIRTPYYDALPRRAPAGATGTGPTGDGDADLAATATLPAPPVGSRAPQVCSTCGMPVQWMHGAIGTNPGHAIQSGWVHVDAVLGADHDVTMEE